MCLDHSGMHSKCVCVGSVISDITNDIHSSCSFVSFTHWYIAYLSGGAYIDPAKLNNIIFLKIYFILPCGGLF